MPRQTNLKNYFNFAKGYITEVSPLVYPEGACKDINNMDLRIDGTVRRRLGIDYESGAGLSTSFTSNVATSQAISIGIWNNVGGDANLKYAVVQIGANLYFHNVTSGNSISTSLKSFGVDLATFKQPYASTATTDRVQITSAKGHLFVVSNQIEPFYVIYNSTTDTISTSRIMIKIRDTVGIDDSLAVNARPSTLVKEHRYNLLNQGWDDTKINAYKAQGSSVYPSNSQIWYIAKDANDVFAPATLDKIDFGTTQAPVGRFLLDAFNQDRSTASGVTGLTSTVIKTRPSTILFYAGRVLYAGTQPGVLFVSKVIEDERDFGVCYQEADPTSEQISDLIDSDGIYLQIPECGSVLRLLAIRDGVLIFAVNGIWQLKGIDGQFTATNFQAVKITDITALSTDVITIVEEVPVFVSESGIYTLEADKVTSLATPVNISINTIQTFVDGLLTTAKKNSTLVYDLYNKQLLWLVSSSETFDGVVDRYKYDTILIYHIRLQAWYKYELPNNTTTPYIVGGFVPTTLNLASANYDVLANADNVMAAGNNVVVNLTNTQNTTQRIIFLTLVNNQNNTYSYSFSLFNNTNFVDWESFDTFGVDYDSYVETGHVILEQAVLNTQINYITTFLERTETRFIDAGDGSIVFDRPSSCYCRVSWDFSDSQASNRWSTPQQVYYFKQPAIYGGIGTAFDGGYSTITTRIKVRGAGKSFYARFYSESGKDMHLLGWTTTFSTAQKQ